MNPEISPPFCRRRGVFARGLGYQNLWSPHDFSEIFLNSINQRIKV